jgi:hypothetical protein
MTITIFQTHFESFSDLIRSIVDRSSAARAEAELDGLILSGDDSVAYAEQHLTEPESEESLAAATLVAFALQATTLYPSILSLLCGEDSDFQRGARLGLRLSNIASIDRELTELAVNVQPKARIAIFDVLSFHRIIFPADVGGLLKVEDPESRCLLLECLGRGRHANLVATFSQDTDPKIRKAFWTAMASSGHSDVINACRRRCAQDLPCHDAIRFLGVVATQEDHKLLRRLSMHEATAIPAMEAMGACGATELVPDILNALNQPLTADAAANALERISGRGIPRSDPPSPPEHLTEDELDFWFHPGEPVSEAAHEWWRQNHYYFEPGKRYQAGRCVSDDPLGPVFDELPDEIRADVYLRERALRPDETPDWELKTWPQYQKNPSWASQATDNSTHTL